MAVDIHNDSPQPQSAAAASVLEDQIALDCARPTPRWFGRSTRRPETASRCWPELTLVRLNQRRAEPVGRHRTPIQNFGSTSFSTTLPSSSVITLSTNNILNGSGDQFVAYVWHDVPGVQKFGSYVGNGNADGPFVEIGFRPAILWIKNLTTNGELWAAHDSKRDPINPAKERFELNSSAAEDNSQDARIKDFLSNGFKIRGTSGEQNTDGDTYIYMAWAEVPAFNLYGGQSNAR